ncbi:hypothetical protein A1O1_08533 [Capronia coronata CBS 617.96]|uniref:MARVEL domain-containing protein n=1 Tax=Capronia coronata CBS 617.96 TaxID=1182541 RepID=W9YDL4_9EURO|nr:uncharacterized protein A1O1_08533 [Capronia coronata CBS 617.96]EXJ80389.1 hypothetical protein A1O1_08533 [Capronia coronata CBS 617.96]
MRVPLDKYGRIKNIIHGTQAAILFLAWILTIAILTRKGHTDGRVGWYFGLCWLMIPFLVYLVMVPMWSRAQRFANVYAFASLDGLSVILWLSAWAAVASYVSAGKGKGDKKDASGCENFKYGSSARCKLSEAIIVFGVFEMLLFLATAWLSFRVVMTYKRTGMMPAQMAGGTGAGVGTETGTGGKPTDEFSDPTQDAFSSNMRPEEEEEGFADGQYHDPDRQEYAYGKTSLDNDVYAPVHQADDNDLAYLPPQQPQSPLSHNGLGIHDYDTSYPGAYGNQGHHLPPR